MIHRARSRDAVVSGILLAFVVLIGLFGSAQWIYTVTLVAIYAMVVIGLNLVLGVAGQVSFAQSAFMAVGAYGSAILTTRHGWSPWLAMLVSAVVSAVAGAVIGLPLVRLRGHYLAMATFALALGTTSLLIGLNSLTGGAIGIAGVAPLSIGTVSLADPKYFFVVVWIVSALFLLALQLLATSRHGRAWRAIATREDIAASLGISGRRYKLIALAIAAAMASVAGSFYAHFTSYVAPDFFDVILVINLLLMLYLGGRGSLGGPVLGSLIIVGGPQLLTGLSKYQAAVFLALLLAVVIVLPSGLLGRRVPGSATFLSLLPPQWRPARGRGDA